MSVRIKSCELCKDKELNQKFTTCFIFCFIILFKQNLFYAHSKKMANLVPTKMPSS